MSYYVPEEDIVMLDLEHAGDRGVYGEDHDWGLVLRDRETDRVVGFEVWEATTRLPAEMISVLPELEGEGITIPARDVRARRSA